MGRQPPNGYENWQDYVKHRDATEADSSTSNPPAQDSVFDQHAPADRAGTSSERQQQDAQMGAAEHAATMPPSAESTHNAYMAQRTSEQFLSQEHTGERAQEMQTAQLSEASQERLDGFPEDVKALAQAAGDQIKSVFDQYTEQPAEDAEKGQEKAQDQEQDREEER